MFSPLWWLEFNAAVALLFVRGLREALEAGQRPRATAQVIEFRRRGHSIQQPGHVLHVRRVVHPQQHAQIPVPGDACELQHVELLR